MPNSNNIIGFRQFEYTSRKSGRSYLACQIYVTRPVSKDGCGLACEAIFVPLDRVHGDLKVDHSCTIYYNRYGSVDAVYIDPQK